MLFCEVFTSVFLSFMSSHECCSVRCSLQTSFSSSAPFNVTEYMRSIVHLKMLVRTHALVKFSKSPRSHEPLSILSYVCIHARCLFRTFSAWLYRILEGSPQTYPVSQQRPSVLRQASSSCDVLFCSTAFLAGCRVKACRAVLPHNSAHQSCDTPR